MRYRKNTLDEKWHGIRSGGCSFRNGCSIMQQQWERERYNNTCRGAPQSHQYTMAEDTAPECPCVRSLLGLINDKILVLAEEVYLGQYGVAPSVLPCQHQHKFMAEFCEELGQWLIRAGLCGAMRAVRSLSSSRRCSHACCSSQAQLFSLSTHRHEGTSDCWLCECSHMWAHHSPSTGPAWNQEHLKLLSGMKG